MNSAQFASLQSLAREARELARSGRAAEATRLWQRVLEADPGNPDALLALAQTALAARDPRSALALLERAGTLGRANPMIELCAALAHKELGDAAAETTAVARALAMDPYFYPALLHKARMLERQGKPRQAARVFRDVLKVMPERDRRDPSLARAVQHAESAVDENMDLLERHVEPQMAAIVAAYDDVRSALADIVERETQLADALAERDCHKALNVELMGALHNATKTIKRLRETVKRQDEIIRAHVGMPAERSAE